MRDTQRGRDIGRGRSRLLTGILMWDSVPKLGYRPEPKADAQLLSHSVVPIWQYDCYSFVEQYFSPLFWGVFGFPLYFWWSEIFSFLVFDVRSRYFLVSSSHLFFFFFFKIFLFIHKRHRERQRHRQSEKQVPCREPKVELNPWTRIMPWAKGRCSTAEPPRHPNRTYLII